jgi:hypothetical protein
MICIASFLIALGLYSWQTKSFQPVDHIILELIVRQDFITFSYHKYFKSYTKMHVEF